MLPPELGHVPGLPPARQAATVELVRDSAGSAIVALRLPNPRGEPEDDRDEDGEDDTSARRAAA